MNDRFIRILSESVLSIESAGNLIVIKTISASGSAAGEAIDSMKWPEVLGTIAGDNTILIIARSESVVESLLQRFDALIKK
jgi:transcriptional regulator of arginine metabolism